MNASLLPRLKHNLLSSSSAPEKNRVRYKSRRQPVRSCSHGSKSDTDKFRINTDSVNSIASLTIYLPAGESRTNKMVDCCSIQHHIWSYNHLLDALLKIHITGTKPGEFCHMPSHAGEETRGITCKYYQHLLPAEIKREKKKQREKRPRTFRWERWESC